MATVIIEDYKLSPSTSATGIESNKSGDEEASSKFHQTKSTWSRQLRLVLGPPVKHGVEPSTVQPTSNAGACLASTLDSQGSIQRVLKEPENSIITPATISGRDDDDCCLQARHEPSPAVLACDDGMKQQENSMDSKAGQPPYLESQQQLYGAGEPSGATGDELQQLAAATHGQQGAHSSMGASQPRAVKMSMACMGPNLQKRRRCAWSNHDGAAVPASRGTIPDDSRPSGPDDARPSHRPYAASPFAWARGDSNSSNMGSSGRSGDIWQDPPSDWDADTGGIFANQQPICTLYARLGYCPRGMAFCNFRHCGYVPAQLNSQGLPLRPGELTCPMYRKPGGCTKGTACILHHPEPGGNDSDGTDGSKQTPVRHAATSSQQTGGQHPIPAAHGTAASGAASGSACQDPFSGGSAPASSFGGSFNRVHRRAAQLGHNWQPYVPGGSSFAHVEPDPADGDLPPASDDAACLTWNDDAPMHASSACFTPWAASAPSADDLMAQLQGEFPLSAL